MSTQRFETASMPTWSTWAQAASVVTDRRNLSHTVSIALLVGTAFFAMKQVGAVLANQMTVALALKSVLTYLVPFCVSNYGTLAATRRR